MPGFRTEITDVAVGGDGVGRAPDGRVAFVRGGVVGDVVEVEITADKDNHVRGMAGSVVEPSEHRIDAPCRFVDLGCGGCGWQHVSLGHQVDAKRSMVTQALERLGKVDPSSVPIDDVELDATAGFRTTIRCAVVDGRAGFRGARSNDVVPVDDCMVAHPFLRDLFAVDWGRVGEVTLRAGARTGERLALVDPSGSSLAAGAVPDDVVLIGRDDLKQGVRGWYHEEVAGRRFRISARSFFQARADGADALVKAVRVAGGDAWGAGRMVDLYGGVGLFASALGNGMSVVVVESSKSSTADARVNLEDRDATVVCDDVISWKPVRADVVVADPPRSGLGWRAAEVVAGTRAPVVVLVSCDAGSFGRDVGLLAERGYALEHVSLIDLFPHTPHVELVSRFVAA